MFLRRCLNLSSLLMLLLSKGSQFHKMGATIVNDLSPVVAADFFSSGVNNISLLDRKLYLVFCLTRKRLDTCEGAISCSTLKVIRMTLNCILKVTGSQCNSFNRGVIWQYFDFIKMTRAAAFRTHWILDIWAEGIQTRGCYNNQFCWSQRRE